MKKQLFVIAAVAALTVGSQMSAGTVEFINKTDKKLSYLTHGTGRLTGTPLSKPQGSRHMLASNGGKDKSQLRANLDITYGSKKLSISFPKQFERYSWTSPTKVKKVHFVRAAGGRLQVYVLAKLKNIKGLKPDTYWTKGLITSTKRGTFNNVDWFYTNAATPTGGWEPFAV